PGAGRDAVAVEELLREDLRALEARARAARAEHEQAERAQLVSEAQAERVLGPHDHQVGALLPGEARDSVEVRGRDVDVARDALRAGVAGRAHDLAHARRGCDLPAQGVLAPAGTD